MTWAERAIALSKEDPIMEGYGHLALAAALIQKGVKAHQRKHYQRPK